MTFPGIGDGSFAHGTRIAVPGAEGERAVEALGRGDSVLTLAGPVRIRHVTATALDPASHGAPSRMLPVLVVAGAIGQGLPRRDLAMPAEQVLYIRDATVPEGALVPLGALVNHVSIRREKPAAGQTWYRLELESQGVVLAEGLAVAARYDPTAPPFAPLLPPGPGIHALRTRLSRAAAEPPVAAPAAAEPADAGAEPAILRVLTDGAALPPLETSSLTVWHFTVPPGPTRLRLVSPPGIPANTEAAQVKDARRFGVAVRTIQLDGTALALDGPAIGEGFHPIERAGTQEWRWTSGDAALSLPPGGNARRLTIEITDWHRLLRQV